MAAKVDIWVGKTGQDSPEAFPLIEHLAGLLHEMDREEIQQPLLQHFESYQRHPLFLGSKELTGTNACKASASHLLALLLMDCNKVKATMPHDKVYSLLGVVNDAASVMGVSPCILEADYGASPADIFKAATTKIVNDNDHLGFTSVAGLANHGSGTDISPSFHQPS
ncbi:hypothetical protein NW762_013582 [Fusarium torreyae]|uniref:Uncharacterized protein n=1 Tax=Fusarium torreyae TaxID=1237075 RepID=A0A9W8RKN1_9HYPO|nr:hypothetical protein NW762_013582 [Fusarium torreyae]